MLPVPLPMTAVRWVVRNAYGRLAVSGAARVDAEIVATYAAQYRSAADIRRLLRYALPVLKEVRSAYDLSRVDCPVLLIWGDHDRLTPVAGANRLLDAIPTAEYVALAGCGHCAQLEEPGRIAELVADFSDRSGAAAN